MLECSTNLRLRVGIIPTRKKKITEKENNSKTVIVAGVKG